MIDIDIKEQIMAVLSELKCTACRAGDDPLNEEEILAHQQNIPGWIVIQENKMNKLFREFKFEDFASAMDFAIQVGKLAEAEGHHPTLQTEWGKVAVTWWTHKINGLHENDFIMAAKTSKTYEERDYEKILRQ